MALGLIDSACIYEVVEALSEKRPNDCHAWAWMGAIEAACAIVGSENIRLAPSPAQAGLASGTYAQLMAGLRGHLGTTRPDKVATSAALKNTRRWVTRNPTAIIASYRRLAEKTPEFTLWLEWSIENAWEEHACRLGGLFDSDLIPQLAIVLHIPSGELESLHSASANPKTLRQMRKDSRFDQLKDAYVVSALIRGRYHDYVAQKSGLQIMHHPLRRGVLPRIHGQRQEFPVANTEMYFASIGLAAAFSQRRKLRVASWTESIIAARTAMMAEELDLRPKEEESVALETAVRAAKQLDISAHSSTLDRALETTTALGLGALTSFWLEGWVGFAVSAGVIAASAAGKKLAKQSDPTHDLISLVSQRKNRLRELAGAGPGRVERHWSGREY